MEPIIRILVISKRKKIRQQLSEALRQTSDLQLVREIDVNKFAASLVTASKPDVILMDAQIPRINGQDASHWMQQCHRGVAKMMVTLSVDTMTICAVGRSPNGMPVTGIGVAETIKVIRTVVSQAERLKFKPKQFCRMGQL